jgi:hypothetical protein
VIDPNLSYIWIYSLDIWMVHNIRRYHRMCTLLSIFWFIKLAFLTNLSFRYLRRCRERNQRNYTWLNEKRCINTRLVSFCGRKILHVIKVEGHSPRYQSRRIFTNDLMITSLCQGWVPSWIFQYCYHDHHHRNSTINRSHMCQTYFY